MPKRTFQPSKKKKKRTLGFRSRSSSTTGKRIIKRRRLKGRTKLTS